MAATATTNVEATELEEPESVKAREWCQNRVGDGSVNYRGICADRRKTGGWKANTFIHILLFADSISVFGIAGNLVQYELNTMHLSLADSVNNTSNFMGVSYMLPIFWGYLADTYFGRYATIAGSSFICFSGLVVLFLAVTLESMKPPECTSDPAKNIICPRARQQVISWYLTGLYLIAVGNAGLKPCLTSMGQDQFDETNAVEKKRGEHFFTSFYANINAAGLLCVTILFYIQSNKGYDWGYGTMVIIYFVGICFFFFATHLYRHRVPAGSALNQAAQVLVAAGRNVWKPLPATSSELFELEDDEAQKKGIRKIRHTNRLRILDKAAIVPPLNTFAPGRADLNNSWRLRTVTQVEEIKTVIQILPIWLCTIIVYTLFAQMLGITSSQALSMDRMIGKFEVPAGSTGVIMIVTAICFIFVYELLIIPVVRKFTGNPKGLTDLQRMGLALFLSIPAMVVSALVEGKRVDTIHEHNISPAEIGIPMIVPLKFYWLFPQFMLLGIIEFLLGVAQLNFFYKETPDTMRSLATSLYFASVSVGFFLSSALVSWVNTFTNKQGSWLNAGVYDGGMKKFYYLLAVITAVNWVAFLACSHWYTYKEILEVEDDNLEITAWKVSDNDESVGTTMKYQTLTSPSKDLNGAAKTTHADPQQATPIGSTNGTPASDDPDTVLKLSMTDTRYSANKQEMNGISFDINQPQQKESEGK